MPEPASGYESDVELENMRLLDHSEDMAIHPQYMFRRILVVVDGTQTVALLPSGPAGRSEQTQTHHATSLQHLRPSAAPTPGQNGRSLYINDRGTTLTVPQPAAPQSLILPNSSRTSTTLQQMSHTSGTRALHVSQEPLSRKRPIHPSMGITAVLETASPSLSRRSVPVEENAIPDTQPPREIDVNSVIPPNIGVSSGTPLPDYPVLSDTQLPERDCGVLPVTIPTPVYSTHRAPLGIDTSTYPSRRTSEKTNESAVTELPLYSPGPPPYI